MYNIIVMDSVIIILLPYMYTVFPLKGGNMALPHPLILKFILKNNTD